MADEEKQKRSLPWAAVVILLLVVYPLSFGPFMWLRHHSYLPRWMRLIYLPIGLLDHMFPWFEKLLNWYMGLWVD